MTYHNSTKIYQRKVITGVNYEKSRGGRENMSKHMACSTDQ